MLHSAIIGSISETSPKMIRIIAVLSSFSSNNILPVPLASLCGLACCLYLLCWENIKAQYNWAISLSYWLASKSSSSVGCSEVNHMQSNGREEIKNTHILELNMSHTWTPITKGTSLSISEIKTLAVFLHLLAITTTLISSTTDSWFILISCHK